MKEKKKLSLAMQIFIALVLAIVAGLLLGNHADFAKAYINPFGTIFLESAEVYRRANCTVFDYERYYFDV